MKNLLNFKFHTPKFTRGFTLVEMMVAVSLFTIVMTVSAGALLTIIDANTKSQTLKNIMNNLNFALEGMSKSIRVGTNYICGDYVSGSDCKNGGKSITFTLPDGGKVTYKLVGSGIYKVIGDVTSLPITGNEVVITNMVFYVTGSDSADTLQPRVLFTLQGYAGTKEKSKTYFNLQTTVSQRQLDI